MIWAFPPNWSSPVVDRYSYLTEILLSESGREQRRAYRVAARRRLEYSALVHQDKFRAMRASLARQDESIIFPDEIRRAKTSVAAAQGSLTMTVPSPPPWIAAGRDLVLDRKGQSREVRTVDAVVGNVVTFANGAVSAWPAGTRLMPALVGNMAPTISTALHSNVTSVVDVELETEPGTEIETVGAAPVTFNGKEVFDHAPNWASPLRIQNVDSTEWIDYQMGRRVPFRPIDFDTEIWNTDHISRSSDELNRTLGVFMRAKGRRGEFYVPSRLDDIKLDAPVAIGTNLWRVAGHDFYDAYYQDTVRRAFEVRLKSGARHFFRVSGVSKSGTTTPYSYVVAIENAPLTINPADIVRISWMPCCRFVSDDLSVTWVTDQLALMTMNYQTTEDL